MGFKEIVVMQVNFRILSDFYYELIFLHYLIIFHEKIVGKGSIKDLCNGDELVVIQNVVNLVLSIFIYVKD